MSLDRRRLVRVKDRMVTNRTSKEFVTTRKLFGTNKDGRNVDGRRIFREEEVPPC